MGITCTIKNYKALQNRIDKLQDAPEKVIKNTLSDVRSRGPGWVASEVVKHYGVSKGEITGGKLGRMTIEGSGASDIKITFRGRVLTPTHFKMTPVTPPAGRSYTLKATILRGQRSTMGKVKKLTKKQRRELAKNLRREGTKSSPHSPIMLMAPNGPYLPFQRKSTNRKDVEIIKTLSMPQMVSSDRASPDVTRNVNDNVEKRFDHHMARFMR